MVQTHKAHAHVRPLIRNEEVLTDLLTRIRQDGGKPDDDQLKLMCELVKLAHEDPDLFVHLQPPEKKRQAIEMFERCRATVLEYGREQLRRMQTRECACDV